MKLGKLLQFTLLFCGLSACKKEDLNNPIYYPLTGRVYQDCMLTKPYANGNIQILQSYTVEDEQPTPFEETIDVKTDSLGSFTFTYERENKNMLYLEPNGGYRVQLPVYVNKDIGQANLFDTNTYVTFVVKTSQPYSDKTLNITEYGIFDLKGPFTNGQVLFKLPPFQGFFWDQTITKRNGVFEYSFQKRGGRFNYSYYLCTKNQIIEVDLDKL